MRFDPIQCSFFNEVYDSLQQLKELQVNVSDYVVIVNVLHYHVPVDHIFELDIVHRILDEQTSYMLTPKKDLVNEQYFNIIRKHQNTPF
jgi:hypothetical protein